MKTSEADQHEPSDDITFTDITSDDKTVEGTTENMENIRSKLNEVSYVLKKEQKMEIITTSTTLKNSTIQGDS